MLLRLPRTLAMPTVRWDDSVPQSEATMRHLIGVARTLQLSAAKHLRPPDMVQLVGGGDSWLMW